MGEHHGYAESKAQKFWDGVSIDAASKFAVQVKVGLRDEFLFERLMHRSSKRTWS